MARKGNTDEALKNLKTSQRTKPMSRAGLKRKRDAEKKVHSRELIEINRELLKEKARAAALKRKRDNYNKRTEV